LLKAHAGETRGPDRIRETLDTLEVDVIQHGIAAACEPRLVEVLVERGIQLNMGLASNVALGLASGYESHPIRALLMAGVDVALGTDDFAVFGTSLCEQILLLRRSGMPPGELARLRIAAPPSHPFLSAGPGSPG
jgi:adenosine deaminase